MRRLIISLVVAEVLGLAALILSVYSLNLKLNDQERARVTARYDTCNLLKTMIYLATPPKEKAQANKFILRSGISNCTRYSHGE